MLCSKLKDYRFQSTYDSYHPWVPAGIPLWGWGSFKLLARGLTIIRLRKQIQNWNMFQCFNIIFLYFQGHPGYFGWKETISCKNHSRSLLSTNLLCKNDIMKMQFHCFVNLYPIALRLFWRTEIELERGKRRAMTRMNPIVSSVKSSKRRQRRVTSGRNTVDMWRFSCLLY